MKNKKIRIAVSLIIGIIVLLFAAYKITYNALAPMVFDYITQKNPEALFKLEETKPNESFSVSGNKNSEDANGESGESGEKASEATGEEAKGETAGINEDGKKQSGGYSTHTSIGTLTAADMARVLKNISPADKTRIISICKSSIAAKDMPKFAKMAKEGITGEDMVYAESYLRSSLSPAQKKEILEIVKKYL